MAGPVFRKVADLLTLRRADVYGRPSEAALEQIRGKAQLLGDAPVVVHDLHSGFSRFATASSSAHEEDATASESSAT